MDPSVFGRWAGRRSALLDLATEAASRLWSESESMKVDSTKSKAARALPTCRHKTDGWTPHEATSSAAVVGGPLRIPRTKSAATTGPIRWSQWATETYPNRIRSLTRDIAGKDPASESYTTDQEGSQFRSDSSRQPRIARNHAPTDDRCRCCWRSCPQCGEPLLGCPASITLTRVSGIRQFRFGGLQ